MTTLGLAIVFFALLMLYCGVKGKSLRHALLGHSVDGGAGSLLTTGQGQTGQGAAAAAGPQPAQAGFLQSNPAPR